MTACFSENIYPKIYNDSLIVITPIQLKQTNLIFLEHQKLQLENIELNNQINDYNSMLNNYDYMINTRTKQIDTLNSIIINKDKELKNINKSLEKTKLEKKIYTGIAIGGITISVSLLLILLISNA